MCAKSSTFVVVNQFFRLTKINHEGSCKSSVSMLTQLDEAETPKF